MTSSGIITVSTRVLAKNLRKELFTNSWAEVRSNKKGGSRTSGCSQQEAVTSSRSRRDKGWHWIPEPVKAETVEETRPFRAVAFRKGAQAWLNRPDGEESREVNTLTSYSLQPK